MNTHSFPTLSHGDAMFGTADRLEQRQSKKLDGTPFKIPFAVTALATLFLATTVHAANVVWSGASGVDTNWSNSANWSGGSLPGTSDDVKFFDGGATTLGNTNNVVDTSQTIGSLQYGNTNSSHTTFIASGVTLTLTNTAGLIAVTPGDIGVAKLITNVITGAQGTLNMTNPAAVISINQGGAAGSSRDILNMGGLSTFTANISRIGVGTTTTVNPANANNKVAGVLYLAQTNVIVLNYTDTLANYQTTGNRTNSIEISKNPGNNGGISSYLYLGQSNIIFLDSVGIGRDKNNGSSTWGWMGFNPAFTNNNPVAYFRGVSGGTNRVTWWCVGDGAGSGSSSNGGAGTNDFSNGIIDALINVMSIGRDATAVDTWAGPHRGNLIFNSGIIDANTIIIGNQSLETGASTTACLGIMNVGSAATLRVNTVLTLGNTTLTTLAATNTVGNLNVNGGTVYASNVTVGTGSSNNIVLANGALIVTNTLATNALGLARLSLTNSVLGLSVPADGSLRALTRSLITGGATNLIQLDSNPVFFSSYPQQFPLVRYTTWTGSNNCGLTNLPTWATGAVLVSNGPNSSLDLLLPADPRPIFTAQPLPYSGSPGDNVTTNFAVSIAASSVNPLGFQWYYVSGGITNQLSDGTGPSGSSILSGSTTTNLQIANAQPADSGNYFVVVTNVYGSNASSQALLTISEGAIPPAVSGPAAVTATNGITTTISDAPSGSPVPDLYWQFNGTPLSNGTGPSGGSTISGANSSTLTIINPQYPGDQGTYSLIASNSAGMATNNTVLTVLVPPAISVQPTNIVVTNTQSASISVTATGVPSPTYQWYKNSPANPISSLLNPSATNATLTFASTSPSDTATYFVVVQNPAGSVTSSNATLIVNSTMSFTALSPINGAVGICYDTPLYITFNQTPVLRNAGKIRIFNVTNSVNPVETIDLSLNAGNGTQARSNYPGDGTPFNYFPVVITGTTAAIYMHSASGMLASNQTYYVTIDDGVFADAAGAYFAGITPTNTWKFATKVSGPVDPINPVVNADGSGDFVTVQGAVDSLALNAGGAHRTIRIRNGSYFELVNISGKTNVTLLGQNRYTTIIKYLNNINTSANSGAIAGRMSFKINANDVILDSLTLTNVTPQGGGQAEALNTGGSRTIVNNCDISSRQDTLLPGHVFFYNSKIYGNFDYIWGGGNLFFYKCVFHTLAGAQNLTAARTPTSVSLSASTPWINPNGTTFSGNGFSFVNCVFEADSGMTGITLAGSNGSNGGLDSWASCKFDPTAYITPTAALSNNYVFWQNQNTDTNGNPISFANVQTIGVTNNDSRLLAVTNITTWLNGWTPALLPNITTNPVSQAVGQGQTANFSVSATGFPDPSYQWLSNGVPIPGSTNTTLSFSNAVRAIAANYSVVASNSSGSVTSAVAVLSYSGNVAPVAAPSSYIRFAGFPLTIVIAGNLATNWSDADGDTVSLSGTISSTNGARVNYDVSFIYYTNANDVLDQINYTVGDGQGGTSGGIINVTTIGNASQSFQAVAIDGDNHPLLAGNGIPGFLYGVQSAVSVVGPWTNAGTTLVNGTGSWNFTDTNVVVPPNNVFYRLYWPYAQ